MTDAIDKLADKLQNHSLGTWKTQAEAILAAVQSDPLAYLELKPLEWIERRNLTWDAKGEDYKIISNRDGTWRVRRNGKVLFARRKAFEAAQASAEAHYRELVRGMFKSLEDV